MRREPRGVPPLTDRRPRTKFAVRARLVLCAAASGLTLAATSAGAHATPEQVWLAECADGSTRQIAIPKDAPLPEARDAALETARPAGCDPVAWKRVAAEPEPATENHERDASHAEVKRQAPQPRPKARRPQARSKPRPPRERAARSPRGVDTTSHPSSPVLEPDPLTTFHTPLVLLPLYRAAGAAHGVPWEVLAAINEVETAYGETLAVSSAGARGWMQFMPQTRRADGVDADGDGVANPAAPAAAIFAAARYLEASGASTDVRGAIFAYNHADWYVDEVLARARQIAAMPEAVVSSLSGLATAGPPVAASIAPGALGRDGSVALRVPAHAAAIAVADGVIERLGRSPALGRYVVLRDDAGNRFVYSGLGRLARAYAAPGNAKVTTRRVPAVRRGDRRRGRLYAHPTRRRAWRAGGCEQLLAAGVPMRAEPAARGAATVAPPLAVGKGSRLRRGARIAAGTVLGSAPRRLAGVSRIRFGVRPAGSDAPMVDPRPLLRAWRGMRHSGAYPAPGVPAPPRARMAGGPPPRRVLEDSDVVIYPCGREDIAAGRIDARVLATLAGMAAAGLRPTVTSLECGHSLLTSGGRVSQHSSGNAVDIGAVNGVPIAGHQGPGGIAERAVRWLLAQRAELHPDQIISLLSLGGASFAQADHADHIHVGFQPRREVEPSSLKPAVSDPSTLPSAAGWQSLLSRVQVLPRHGL